MAYHVLIHVNVQATNSWEDIWQCVQTHVEEISLAR